ncbi:hypothetical protein M8494_01670 [Serratia ureilytica]
MRVKNGTLRKGDKIKVMSTGQCTTPTAWASSRGSRSIATC